MKLITALTIACLLTACSSIPAKMNQIKTGMPKSEVVGILGMPDSSSGLSFGETAYYDRVVAFGTRETFFVEYENDQVRRFGSLGQRGPDPASVMMMQNSMNQQMQANQRMQAPLVQPRPASINCTSNAIGGTTYTNCR